jgi:predicted nuclease of predicted toxin-antitoxin system
MAVRFLADACCDFGIVKGLREAGIHVDAVSEIAPDASDDDVMNMAIRDKRVLITEDKDFGQLVYAAGQESIGILFLRYHVSSRTRMLAELVQLIRLRGENLIGAFVVVQPGRSRIRRLVDPPG